MRKIGVEELEDIALGAAVLGTGGGGDPYIGKLMAAQAIRQHGPVTLLDVDELVDEEMVVCAAMMGAPTVMVEKVPRGDEVVRAFRNLETYLNRKVKATMSIEAGGLNSTTPFVVAATLGIPLVDADGMGRAFPELQMVTMTLYDIPCTPMAVADEKGNSLILQHTIDNLWTERLARNATIDMGCSSMIAQYSMTGSQAKKAVIRGTITYAEQIGRTIRLAHQQKADAVEAVLEVTGGFRLFEGKVSDVRRRTQTGFARGEAIIEGTGPDAGHELTVKFQNEHLIALRDGEPVATAPDLITMLNVETGDPITTEGLRYGFRVVVLGIPCDARWRTARGLELVGPRYFGYDIEYVPVEERYRGKDH